MSKNVWGNKNKFAQRKTREKNSCKEESKEIYLSFKIPQKNSMQQKQNCRKISCKLKISPPNNKHNLHTAGYYIPKVRYKTIKEK
jgi:hypothetical protein